MTSASGQAGEQEWQANGWEIGRARASAESSSVSLFVTFISKAVNLCSILLQIMGLT